MNNIKKFKGGDIVLYTLSSTYNVYVGLVTKICPATYKVKGFVIGKIHWTSTSYLNEDYLFKIEDEALKLISNDAFLKIKELREEGG